MTKDAGIALSDLGTDDVPLIWHEAVAVVQAIAAAAAERGSVVPDPASIRLLPNGTPAWSAAAASTHPVRTLALALDRLVGTQPVPSQLRQVIAADHADPPAHATIEEFSRALAFFERPGRESDLLAVASRAAAILSNRQSRQELERVAAKARAASKEKPRRTRSLPRRRLVLAAVLIPAVAAAVGGATLLIARFPGVPGESLRSLVTLPAWAEDRIGGLLVGTAPPGPAPGREEIAEKSVARPGRRQATVATQPARPPDRQPPLASRPPHFGITWAPAAGPAPLPSSPIGTGRALALDVGRAALPPAVPSETDVVYTAEHGDVIPPEMIYPQLPAEPPEDVAPSAIGTFDIVVNEAGAVERVRLVSPANRYHERMLVAAVKAWRFAPAMKDGRPVKYRLRIKITL